MWIWMLWMFGRNTFSSVKLSRPNVHNPDAAPPGAAVGRDRIVFWEKNDVSAEAVLVFQGAEHLLHAVDTGKININSSLFHGGKELYLPGDLETNCRDLAGWLDRDCPWLSSAKRFGSRDKTSFHVGPRPLTNLVETWRNSSNRWSATQLLWGQQLIWRTGNISHLRNCSGKTFTSHWRQTN